MPAGEVQPGAPAAASRLMLRLKLMKERQAVEGDRIKVRAKAEQAELRLRTRSEQIGLEMELAELGEIDESELEPLRVTHVVREPESPSVEGVLSAEVRLEMLKDLIGFHSS